MNNRQFNAKEKSVSGGRPENAFINNQFNQRRGVNDNFILNTIFKKPQCKNARCKNDDLKFAVDGFCIRCVQRVEFITREFPKYRTAVKSEVQR